MEKRTARVLRRLARRAGVWLAIAGLAAGEPAHAAAFSIARPNFGVPEFARTGGTFRVEVKAAAGLNSNQWTATLWNDLRAWTGTVERALYGTYVDNNTAAGYALTVRLPAGIPPELFRLQVLHPAGGAATNRHAVSVVQEFDRDFYLIHYADPQAEVRDATTASGLYGSHGCIQELGWHVPVFNLINPRLLLDTGDELDNNYVSWAHYEEYKTALDGLTVPLLATRGNNDVTAGGSDWLAQFGVPTYSVTMGSFYVCQKDYLANDYYAWFTNDYAAACAGTGILYRLFGQHYNSGGYAYIPPAGRYPDLMLVGHAHDSGVLQSSPYTVLKTVHGCDYGKAALIEFNRGAASWTCPSRTNHPSGSGTGGNVFQAVGDWGAPRLTNTLLLANDGTARSNRSVIVNSIPKRFRDGRVRFLLRSAGLGYQVTGGEKLAEYDYGASNAAVLVRVDIAASASTTVTVVRVDSDGDGMPDDWERLYFPNLAVAGPATDSDGDGALDAEEYTAGTVPTNRTSRLTIQSATAPAASRFVLRWPSVAERLYGVSWADDPRHAYLPLASNLSATPPENVYTDAVHAGASRAFYRITVRKP
jgi:hypothetical protein